SSDLAVTEDNFWLLGGQTKLTIPHALLPPLMKSNDGYIVSLGLVCAWLGEQAEALGVEIYPGFAAAEILYNEQGEVIGVATSDMGRDKNGNEKPEST